MATHGRNAYVALYSGSVENTLDIADAYSLTINNQEIETSVFGATVRQYMEDGLVDIKVTGIRINWDPSDTQCQKIYTSATTSKSLSNASVYNNVLARWRFGLDGTYDALEFDGKVSNFSINPTFDGKEQATFDVVCTDSTTVDFNLITT
jgi:hypothetical protein